MTTTIQQADQGTTNRAAGRTSSGPANPPTPRPALITRALLIRFVSLIGSSTSFYLLLSVVPLYARSSGSNAAGVATGALMASTVVGELVTPRLVAQYGYRRILVAGLVLMGVPALALSASSGLGWVVAICLIRGLGFAFTLVAGSALTVTLIPPERRGEGLALVGVVSGIPALIALPAGIWLSANVGYPAVFAAAAVAALVALASIPALPDRQPGSPVPGSPVLGVVSGLRSAALLRPAIAFSTTTMGAGIVVTFLPLAATRGTGDVAALALLAQSAASTLGRLLAGRRGDRHGPAGLLAPGLLLAATGMLALALTTLPVALISGAVLFGLGFGAVQNASLSLMYAHVTASGYGAVGALWNLAYDGGMGVGAAGFGLLAPHLGYPLGFALTAVPMLIVLPLTRRSSRSTPRPA
jgi:MFS family permease